jgi:hypothetical protein
MINATYLFENGKIVKSLLRASGRLVSVYAKLNVAQSRSRWHHSSDVMTGIGYLEKCPIIRVAILDAPVVILGGALSQGGTS